MALCFGRSILEEKTNIKINKKFIGWGLFNKIIKKLIFLLDETNMTETERERGLILFRNKIL